MSPHNADFITKLVQIEQLANAVHGELPHSLSELPHSLLMLKTRVQHIVVLAKNLRGRLEFGSIAIVPVEPRIPPPGEAKKPPL